MPGQPGVVAWGLAVGLAVALAAALVTPAAAEIDGVAENQRMVRMQVSPRDVAEIQSRMPRIAALLTSIWTDETQRAGASFVPPKVRAYTREFRHPNCGRVEVNNVGHCHSTNEIVYDPIFLAAVARIAGGGKVRDGWYAVIVIMAHEWGHAVVRQTQAGVFRSRRMHESTADCLAGAAIRTAFDAGLATPGDVDIARRTLNMTGDRVTSEENEENIRIGRGHGTGPERMKAFQFGFDNGAGRCLTVTASR